MAALFKTPVPLSVRLLSLSLAFVAAAGVAASIFLATDYRSTAIDWRTERVVLADQIAGLRVNDRRIPT